MKWNYLFICVIAAISVVYVIIDYKKGNMEKKKFLIALVGEILAFIMCAILYFGIK